MPLEGQRTRKNMQETTTLALGYYDVREQYQMVCRDCLKEIPGTIDQLSLRLAIISNANRGGIKCPECRAKSCDMCGGQNVLEAMVWPTAKPGFGYTHEIVNLCKLCCLDSDLVCLGYRVFLQAPVMGEGGL